MNTIRAIILGIFLVWMGFFVFAQDTSNQVSYPDPKTYAPNLWFDSEEKYYPANPLDFYYDDDLNELGGKEARATYDALSQDEKLKNFRVFYNIDDSGNEIVYQYWLFYVFNNASNEHYGDWESIFVFVDLTGLGGFSFHSFRACSSSDSLSGFLPIRNVQSG